VAWPKNLVGPRVRAWTAVTDVWSLELLGTSVKITEAKTEGALMLLKIKG